MVLKLKPDPDGPLPPFSFSTAPPSPPNLANGDGTWPQPERPPADFIPERDMWMFGAQPLAGSSEAGRGLMRCMRCERVVMESAVGEHKRICSHILDGTPLTVKKSTKSDKTLKSTGGIRKRRASDLSSASSSPLKKRTKLPTGASSPFEAEDDDRPLAFKGMKKSQIKKMRKEQARLEKKAAKAREKAEVAERKRQRANGPIDLDKQCGVINDKGLPCPRSLTCKTHTVGLKRGVLGRSRPYDELFLEWQRTHNPNFKEPTLRRDNPTGAKTKRPLENGKRKKGQLDEDDDGVDGEGEDGQREMEELIHFARLAGERLCPRNSSGSVWISVIGGGFAGVGPSRNTGAGAGPLSAGGAGAEGGFGRKGKVDRPGQSGLMGQVTGVGSGNGVWRAGNYEFAQVGDMLTKALAARPERLPPTTINISKNKLGQQGGQPLSARPVGGGMMLNLGGMGVTAAGMAGMAGMAGANGMGGMAGMGGMGGMGMSGMSGMEGMGMSGISRMEGMMGMVQGQQVPSIPQTLQSFPVPTM